MADFDTILERISKRIKNTISDRTTGWQE